MECNWDLNDEKIYDPIKNVWTDNQGRKFIKNEFNPDSPIWIDISTSRWSVDYLGKVFSIDWNEFDLRPEIVSPINTIVIDKLNKLAPSYISIVKNTLFSFQKASGRYWEDFNVSTNDFHKMWEKIGTSYRPHIRVFYQDMANRGLGSARPDLAHEIDSWIARSKVKVLPLVRQWDPKAGALTSSEEQALRRILRDPGKKRESPKDHATRIYGWLLLDTLKRASQVLEIPRGGLKCIPTNGRDEWFVEIRPIKYQTGMQNRWWHICEDLAKEIISFSNKSEVAALQNEYDRLIVWNAKSLFIRGMISSTDSNIALKAYVYKRGAISPRTGEPLHVTQVRIRHTGATRLAFAGVSKDIIQEILEHDSPETCQAYIDAVGSEIVPQIEKAGRAMGNIFFELNKSYFQGKVVSETAGAPIVVPEYSATPLIVGSCNRDPIKDGGCKKHPFLSCYADCNSFMAWNIPGPHEKALRYFESERMRWNETRHQGGEESLSVPIRHQLAIFDKAIGSAKEVLSLIRGEEQ